MAENHAKKIGTKEKPTTPPLSPDSTMHVEEKDGVEVLVCTVGKTVLLYQLRAITDLLAMLKKHGDWLEFGSADEQKPAKGNGRGVGAFAEEPGWRVVRPQEGSARPLRHVPAAADGALRLRRADPRGEGQPDAGEGAR